MSKKLREIGKILTERKHLDNKVDEYVRNGMNRREAFNKVVEVVRSEFPNCERVHYKSADSYVNCRNRERREQLKKMK